MNRGKKSRLRGGKRTSPTSYGQCRNTEDLITYEPITNIGLSDLILLPSGNCVRYTDLQRAAGIRGVPYDISTNVQLAATFWENCSLENPSRCERFIPKLARDYPKLAAAVAMYLTYTVYYHMTVDPAEYAQNQETISRFVDTISETVLENSPSASDSVEYMKQVAEFMGAMGGYE